MSTDAMILRFKQMLVEAHVNPYANKDHQRARVEYLSKQFRKMLTEKALQESVYEVCRYDGSEAEYTRTRPAYSS